LSTRATQKPFGLTNQDKAKATMDDPTVTEFNTPLTSPPSSGVGNADPATWGPFKIIQKVGHGGFGDVYQAFDTILQREIALKLLRPDGQNAGGQEAVQQVLHEARQMARVRHPNVVTVYGVDTFDGRAGFWTDFVRGKTLTALLALNGPMGARETAHIGIDLAKAVGAVHAAGLLHRDIKTSNVMREEGGRILLMDFGLTHDIEGEHDWSGTPPYMAPELLSGSHPSVATDIYALGVLFFHLLTGKYPYGETTWDSVKQAIASGVRLRLLDARPDLPEALAGVVERASDANPAKRYSSAGELIAALAEAEGTSSQTISQSRIPVVTPKKPAGRRGRAWLAAPVLGLLMVGGWFTPAVRHFFAGPSSGANAQYLEAHELLDRYYKPGNTAQAIALLEKCVAQYPDNGAAWADLARANLFRYREDARFETAVIQAADQALNINRNNASVHVTLSWLYRLKGSYDIATEHADAALALDRTNAEAHWARGELLLVKGSKADAEQEFLTATQLAPTDWFLQDQLGYYYGRVGNLAMELTSGEEAARLSPDNFRVLNNLGLLYRRLGRIADAKVKFLEAIQLNQSNPALYHNLGLVLGQERNFSEAIAMFEKALALDAQRWITWNALGLVYRDMETVTGQGTKSTGAFLRAVETGERARKLRPKDPLLLSSLGVDYAALGQESKAVPLLTQAILLAPDEPQELFQAGLAYELLHKRGEAIQWMQKALEHGLSLASLDADPGLTALRADQRFVVVRKQFERNTQKE
jgi:eukaryotic-like serine/threonine-protein kinase